MPNTFELIASSTVGSGGASSIDFTSISGSYTDLCVMASIRTNYAAVSDDMCMRFNGSTTSYTNRQLFGTGSAVGTGAPFTDRLYIGAGDGNNATSSTFSSNCIYIPNYAGSNNKSLSTEGLMENNATEAYMNMVAGLWSNSAAITSISIFSNYSSTISQHSTAYLYGVKNA
jgi:hypothetical protein